MTKYILLSLILLPSILAAETLQFSTLKGMLTADICENVLRYAYQNIGIEIKVKKYPAKRSLILSSSGAVDGELMRIIGAEKNHPDLVRIKTSICRLNSKVYVKNLKFKFNGWQSLNPYKIAIHRGHLYAEKGTKGMNATSLGSDKQMMAMLLKDRVDLVISQVPDATKALYEINNSEIIGLAPPITTLRVIVISGVWAK